MFVELQRRAAVLNQDKIINLFFKDRQMMPRKYTA
jgi:hypothetical protein